MAFFSDVGACTSCGEEDSCELLASGNQCLPTTITVASRGGVQSSRQASSPEGKASKQFLAIDVDSSLLQQ